MSSFRVSRKLITLEALPGPTDFVSARFRASNGRYAYFFLKIALRAVHAVVEIVSRKIRFIWKCFFAQSFIAANVFSRMTTDRVFLPLQCSFSRIQDAVLRPRLSFFFYRRHLEIYQARFTSSEVRLEFLRLREALRMHIKPLMVLLGQ